MSEGWRDGIGTGLRDEEKGPFERQDFHPELPANGTPGNQVKRKGTGRNLGALAVIVSRMKMRA